MIFATRQTGGCSLFGAEELPGPRTRDRVSASWKPSFGAPWRRAALSSRRLFRHTSRINNDFASAASMPPRTGGFALGKAVGVFDDLMAAFGDRHRRRSLSFFRNHDIEFPRGTRRIMCSFRRDVRRRAQARLGGRGKSRCRALPEHLLGGFTRVLHSLQSPDSTTSADYSAAIFCVTNPTSAARSCGGGSRNTGVRPGGILVQH